MTTARMGLGLAALGRPAYLTKGRAHDLGTARTVDDLRALTARTLDAAYDAGVRYVDAARSYGLSEDFLASWLRSRPDVDDVTIASKWGYTYVGDWRLDVAVHEVKEHSLEAYERQVAETRGLLGDRLDVYQTHSVTPDSPLLTDMDLQQAVGELRDQGVRVGISTSGPAQAEAVRRALDLEVAGRRLVTVVQSTWNLLEQSVGAALQEAADAGVHVVVKEGVANGRLSPGADDGSDAAMRAQTLASDRGVSVDQVALAAILHQPWAGHVLSGAAAPEQVVSNVQAEHLALSSDELAELTASPETPDEYWERRSQRPWA